MSPYVCHPCFTFYHRQLPLLSLWFYSWFLSSTAPIGLSKILRHHLSRPYFCDYGYRSIEWFPCPLCPKPHGVLHQLVGSEIFEMPRFKTFIERWGAHAVNMWLGMYGAPTWKMVKIFSSDPFIYRLFRTWWDILLAVEDQPQRLGVESLFSAKSSSFLYPKFACEPNKKYVMFGKETHIRLRLGMIKNHSNNWPQPVLWKFTKPCAWVLWQEVGPNQVPKVQYHNPLRGSQWENQIQRESHTQSNPSLYPSLRQCSA